MAKSVIRFMVLVLVVCMTSCAGSQPSTAASTRTFHPEDYGAKGNGRTNDLNALQRLTRAVNENGGGIVVFGKGKTYRIAIEDDPNGGHTAVPIAGAMALNFEGCQRPLTIDMQGATIELAPNHSTKYALFRFFNCKQFTLQGGNLVGDALKHDYSDVTWRNQRGRSTHEWGTGIQINGASGTIRDMSISYMTGDGIYAGNYKQDGAVYLSRMIYENLEVSYCRKNGIGQLSTDGTTFSNCHIHHIGTSDKLQGTAPMAGIDFEYEDKLGGKGDIILHGCHIHDCGKNTIVTSNLARPTPQHFLMEDCTIEGSCLDLVSMNSPRGKFLRRCTVSAPIFLGATEVDSCTFQIGGTGLSVSGTTFRNCTFMGRLKGFDEEPHGSCFMGNNGTATIFEDCTFRDIRGTNDNNISRQGFSGYAFSLNAQFRRCTFQNVTFGRGRANVKSSYQFDQCTLDKDCVIYNGDDEQPIIFKNSTLNGVTAGTKKTGRFQYENCNLIACPLTQSGKTTFKKCNVKK
ncbi:MAG: right-handed parallel beta-helix repeat-containing protein [Bacteroidaceae bacterium]|nr:right-handed parallel beta-helix repeat-containing protein [Bacteroidaceae bacterium]